MSDYKADLPTESVVRSESSKYNEGTKLKQQIHEERNTAENWKPIMDAIAAGRARDINDEPKQKNAPPCIVVSSGPSLDESIEHLKGWRGDIFCSTSHATTLMHLGIEPTYIVILDPFCAWHELAGVDWSKTKTKIIANPSIWPDIFANWPNEILLFLQNVGKRDSYYATTQLHMFCERIPPDPRAREPQWKPLIRTELTLFACTPPAEIFCADILRYGRAFLCGCDFAYSPDRARFTRWQPNAEGVWTKDVSPVVPGEATVRTNNGLYADVHLMYYKKNFISAWRLSRQQLYSTDKWTACTEIPHVDIEWVIEHQGRGIEPLAEEEIIKRTENYLAKVGAWIIMRKGRGDGISFVETNDPLTDLPHYMQEGRRVWECMRCKMQGKANDDEEHTSDVCSRCGNVGLQRIADCDIDANMARIRQLLADNPPPPKLLNVVKIPPGCSESTIGTDAIAKQPSDGV